MKKISIFAIISVFIIGLSGCGNHTIKDSIQTTETDAEYITNTADYKNYEGTWSVDGMNHDDIISSGGTEIVCRIENHNEFSGSFFTQQGGSERFAFIDEITGIIENDELYFPFDDDGWGGRGTIHFIFSDDKILIDITDYQIAESNRVGYGLNGSYEMIKVAKQSSTESTNNVNNIADLTSEDLQKQFYEQFYSGLSNEEIEERVTERTSYYHASKYYKEIVAYWEQARGVTDISNVIEPLYYTSMKYYSAEDFADEPAIVIHLAKNEIYAMHGYIFKDEDLNNYFMGCAWYQPVVYSDEFDDSIFNDFERKNLNILSALDIQ